MIPIYLVNITYQNEIYTGRWLGFLNNSYNGQLRLSKEEYRRFIEAFLGVQDTNLIEKNYQNYFFYFEREVVRIQQMDCQQERVCCCGESALGTAAKSRDKKRTCIDFLMDKCRKKNCDKLHNKTSELAVCLKELIDEFCVYDIKQICRSGSCRKRHLIQEIRDSPDSVRLTRNQNRAANYLNSFIGIPSGCIENS